MDLASTVGRAAPAIGDPARLAAVLARRHGPEVRVVAVEARPLRGGLQAAAVQQLGVRFAVGVGPERAQQLVVKRLLGADRREAAVYAWLDEHAPAGMVPRLWAAEGSAAACDLFLERVSATRPWPWGREGQVGLVLQHLARLHRALPVAAFGGPLAEWDYEAELAASAAATLRVYEEVAAQAGAGWLREAGPALRRVAAALPAMRRALRVDGPLGRAVIHGDVHSGNVLVRERQGVAAAVFLDWGRARLGSPLEDVSSWLHSLGLWAPEARRRHDRLLRRYLVAAGLPDRLDASLRRAYWLAGASNALAGALRYHLAVMEGWGGPAAAARERSLHAARASLRVVRRADAYWRR